MFNGKIIFPEEVEKKYQFFNGVAENALNFDIEEEYKKIDNKTERSRVLKRLKFQLQKLLPKNEQYQKRSKTNKQNYNQFDYLIKLKNNKIKIESFREQFK